METKGTSNNPKVARKVTSALRPRRLTVQKPTNAIHDLIAGGIAGSAGIVVGHPLDSLKVRIQMDGGSIRKLLSQSSRVGSVWNGLPAPLVGAAALNSCMFLTHGFATRLWDAFFDTNNNHGVAKEAVCGGITGFVSTFIMCPTEHIKTKLQTNSNMYKNSFHAAQQIFKTHGLAGLNRGFVATAVRQTPGFCVYFSTYQRLKHTLHSHDSIQCNHLAASILAGGIAGSFSWAIVYPIDLIKSRIQALPLDCNKIDRSILSIGNKILQERGWKALYRGFGITVLRAFPVNAVILTTHSELVGWVNGCSR